MRRGSCATSSASRIVTGNTSRTRANDPFVLRLRAHHEARDILHEQQRNALPVAAIDEVGDLLRAFGVDDAAEPRPLPGTELSLPNGIDVSKHLDAEETAKVRGLVATLRRPLG